MKATLEFHLPEDEQEFRVCQQGMQWRGIVSNMAEWLRYQRKHAELTVEELEANDKLTDMLFASIKLEDLKL